ncbi:FecCD family ABC transporter permease [Bermanella sp. WJH001]|uniref:FecCD family ABC transporter permease n=1 Tax=Bermanella sp. WJH001 TaxID=3048005 RepID=UPI0024BE2C6D|nr:iron ABC transporter permease [Bermanella sp. WJH001]MDJ1539139.1 iron ABC transporter permease [Bermanella sp. WJH001]
MHTLLMVTLELRINIMFKVFSYSVIAVFILLLSAVMAVSFGAANISSGDVLSVLFNLVGADTDVSDIKQRIILELRIPRLILAFLTGAGLSLAGAVLQTVTRNPLADPYLFGIASGASFGAVLVIASIGGGAGWAVGQMSITTGAFIGAALSVLIVLSLAGRGVQIERMLLAGVAASFMFSAGTSLVLYASDPEAAASLLFWTLGSFTRANWDNLWVPSVVIISCLILFLGYSRALKAVLAGDETAKTLGVNVTRLRMGMLLLSSLLTATLVANTGGIGFVGLMIPHIVRRLLQSHQQYVLLACVLFGGVFMVWVDVLARSLVANNELPIGVITAAIGSVFFLLVLRKRSWIDS